MTLRCRSAPAGGAVDEQRAALERMAADLSALRRSHAALLAALPADAGAAVPPDARANYDGLQHAQRAWEDRMSALLDAVSSLQSPGGARGGRGAPVGSAVASAPPRA
jgi:hypothetical protein